MTPSSDRIALFIDGANLYATAKTLGFDIDYKRLLKEFQGRGTLVRAFAAQGWGWGGSWSGSTQDTQHFSYNGR